LIGHGLKEKDTKVQYKLNNVIGKYSGVSLQESSEKEFHSVHD
jgi:hypothetical protein